MRIVLTLVALALAACSQQPAAYGPDVERNFLVSCQAQGASNELCGCTWDRIEADISPGDFAALERLPGPQREDHPLTLQINGYVEACNASLAPQIEPATDGTAPAP